MNSSNEEQQLLPELNNALLDSATVLELFRDIAACTKVFDVRPKFASRKHISERAIELDEAQSLLISGGALGVQIRYQYEGAEWWDTLMHTPEGIRLVRIRHDFGDA